MSTPYPPEGYSQPQQPPAAGYPNPGYPAPYNAAYPGQPAANPGYPAPNYAVDPAAPYGRDPGTGEPLSDKSGSTAGLLQLFFGMWGVGRFYLGYTTIGAIQLGLWLISIPLIFIGIGFLTLGAVGIWALVDAIMMFTGSVKDIQGRKLR